MGKLFYKGDPAAQNIYEVHCLLPRAFGPLLFTGSPTCLYKLGVPLMPRLITEYAHAQTGIDIHPAAVIGHHFFIDHGTGVVVGETAVIGNHVKLYQGVTLGALSISKELAARKTPPYHRRQRGDICRRHYPGWKDHRGP